MNNITLKAVFANNKEKLSILLNGLSLPKDSQRIHTIVTDFLGNLFENNGDFRQNLTESEDFLFQASMRLLQAQHNLSQEFANACGQYDYSSSDITLKSHKDSSSYLPVVGTGIGALAGGFISTWAAVAGAIAGTALVIYCSAKSPSVKNKNQETKQQIAPSIDTERFCNILEQICESIDGVIDTFRVQVKRVANVYEQREMPSFLSEYSTLSEQIANVIQTSNNCGMDVPEKLRNAISIMEESLENYDLKFENGKLINA